MRFGMLLLGEHDPNRLLELARFAEQSDFEHIWYADEKFFRDPYCSLTFLSQHTKRIKLGTCVTDPYTRHPAIAAMAMASLDELAGGRGVLGIGAGFSGLQAMGIPRDRPVAALREAIELVRRLWAGGTVTYEGETVSFRDGELNFRARPDIPIAVASAGKQILTLAGEVADKVILGDMASPEVIGRALEVVKAGAAKVGRLLNDIYLVTRVNLILTDDMRSGADLMRPWITGDLWGIFPNWGAMFTYRPEWDQTLRPLREFIEDYGGRPRNVGDFALITKYNDLVSDEMVLEKALVGPVDSVAGQIVSIARMGVQEIVMYPLPLPDQDIMTVFTRFQEEVRPQVEKALA